LAAISWNGPFVHVLAEDFPEQVALRQASCPEMYLTPPGIAGEAMLRQ
jgi:hypothetical protein